MVEQQLGVVDKRLEAHMVVDFGKPLGAVDKQLEVVDIQLEEERNIRGVRDVRDDDETFCLFVAGCVNNKILFGEVLSIVVTTIVWSTSTMYEVGFFVLSRFPIVFDRTINPDSQKAICRQFSTQM